MILKDIFENVKIINSNREIDFNSEVDNISFHTDDVTKNSIFVAIKGYITDGHKYISVAKDKGAKYIVVENFVDVDIAQIKVENSRIALADIANNFYKEPSKELNIVGITATNGKTTTSFMTDKIFKDAGYKTGIIGTVYTKYDGVNIPSILTTPESLELQGFFRDMADKQIEKVTMEVSSSSEELYRVKNVDFDVVTFNNFSREHIDQHGSFERYYEVKSKLIKEASEDAVAVLNIDFDKIKELKDKTKAQVLTYSLKNKEEDFAIDNLDLSTGKGKYTFIINRDIKYKDIIIEKNSFDIELDVAGYSSVMNSVVAIIIALLNNIDIKTIQDSINSFAGVERRFEMIYDENFKIIDDHYANVRNIDVTLSTLSEMEFNNFHMLYAIRGNRGVNLNKETAEKTAEWLKKLDPKTFYATLSKDVVMKKDEVSKEELEIFLSVMKENNIDVKVFDTLEESVKSIIDNAKSNDVVLLAGCQGMDKGAGFAVDELIKNNETKHKEILLDKVKNRIC
ncbi:Mur ligase family protein [Peptoniphilus stercorisuis]|uniref:UDP-N-acetylmuramoyl-L-alanyl-D-glutamate--2, 6-diaminopimelate ligase n=1 Tax=Peptoniphilus stercorisuis TaxID=1436965 RepID=A0ABS4KBP7_9FIRM|nr:Mur ligase family protein [Peptoniphilus stercorisuis]MBP2025197.1 UDP-N-acetylmuramoyl-L-alanyl-D-glutamate--2,6-diaminopimelate ligase [Peptoniphilus stercorisuis]